MDFVELAPRVGPARSQLDFAAYTETFKSRITVDMNNAGESRQMLNGSQLTLVIKGDASASLRLVPNSAHGREPNRNTLAIHQPNSDERRPWRYVAERV